ncbi:2-iminoacetate synthase ThiH [Shewanella algae]|uniref:2-iminoacetate synthase ThiH n=1 Tax=Shewanella algae TaxID=38313 RepID=UPI001AAE6E59|nr:2-iminoacetate synthase ThiH [Shewanella algae]MBO2628652.1 2-iminoacetate synthase ThiH [Shewanella algae]
MADFLERFTAIDRDLLRLAIASVSAAEVERCLARPETIAHNPSALPILLSPAAREFLEPMAQLSAALTRKKFGANIGLYAPLYVSNLCANDCDYCGFSMSNKIRRKTLSQAELDAEIAILKQRGFDSVLLVSGEHETKVGLDYFAKALLRLKQDFSYLAIEVQPLAETGYRRLVDEGLDAVMVYQETYQPATYDRHHLRGNKKDFGFRLNTPDRAARAGVDKIGLGVLLGLDDWRLDSALMGLHLDYLQQKYWRSRFSVSLPRLRPCVGGVTPAVTLDDAGLVQLICAMRLFSPALELSLSTRESASLRDNLLPLGITHVSAASSTEPGGYSNPKLQLDQFQISDERTVPEVVSAIRAQGMQPVWKDWDASWLAGASFAETHQGA